MSSSSPNTHSSNVDDVVSRIERLQQARGVARGSVRDRLYRKFVEAVREEEGLGGRRVGAQEGVTEAVEEGKLPRMRPAEVRVRATSPMTGILVNAQAGEGPTKDIWGVHEQPKQQSPGVNHMVVMKDEDEDLVSGEGAGWDHQPKVGCLGNATGATERDVIAKSLPEQWQDTPQSPLSPARKTSSLVGHQTQEAKHTIQMLQTPHSTLSPPAPPSLKLEIELTSTIPAVSLSTANPPSKWSNIYSMQLGSQKEDQIVGAPTIPFTVIATESPLPVQSGQTHLTINTQHPAQQPDIGGLGRVMITEVREESVMTILNTEIVSPTGAPMPGSRSPSLKELRRRASLINAATPGAFTLQNVVTRASADTEYHGINEESPLRMARQPEQNRALRRSTRSQTKIIASMDVEASAAPSAPAALPTCARAQSTSRPTRQVQFATPVRDASATSASRKTAATPTESETQGESLLPGHSYTILGRHHAYCKACTAQRKSVTQTGGQSKKSSALARRSRGAPTGGSMMNTGYHQFPYPDDVDWESESMAFRCLQTGNPLLGSSSANLTREMAGHMKSCGTGIRSRSDGGAWEVNSMYVANTGGLVPSAPIRGRGRQVVSAYVEDWKYYREGEGSGVILGMEESWPNSLEALADAAVNERGGARGERTSMLRRNPGIIQGQFCQIRSWNGRVDFPESAIRGECRPKEDADTEETLAERLGSLREGWRVGIEDKRVTDDTVGTDDSDTILDPDLSLSTETNDDTIDANDISFSTDSSGDTIDMNNSSTSATACECEARDSTTPPLPYAHPRGTLQSPATPGPLMRYENGQTVQVRDSDDLSASEYETSSTVGCLGNGNTVGSTQEPLLLVRCNSLPIEPGVQSSPVKRKRSPSPAVTGEDLAQRRLMKKVHKADRGMREERCNGFGGEGDDDGDMEVHSAYTNKIVNPNPLFTDELLAKLLAMPRQGL